jgi:hypothetical protein
MCLKTIIAYFAQKTSAAFGGATGLPHGPQYETMPSLPMVMSGPAQNTATQSRLDHAAWMEQMRQVYLDPRQNPARMAIYKLYKKTKWNGEKQARARQAKTLTNLIFLGVK